MKLRQICGILISALITCIAGITIGFLSFVAIIGIYVELIMPDIVTGNTISQDLARCFQLETSQLDDLVERKILTDSELDLLISDSSIRRDVVWRAILPVYGIYPYPAGVYLNLPFPTTATIPSDQPYLDARAAAIVCGLADIDDDPTEGMPQEEYDTLIDTLETGTVALPTCTFNCPYLQQQVWDIDTYRGRNSLIVGWELIPESWREDFTAQGWDINFTLPSVIQVENGEASRHETAGLTDYQAKTISLDTSNPSTTIHEFAHYVAYRVGWLYNADFEANYTAEASVLADILGDYSQTTPREYFAEMMSFWILHPDRQSELRTLAPQTAVWVERAITSFPSLVPSPEAP